MRILVCSVLLTVVVTAADFSGKWKGGIINTLPSGETRQTQQIYMDLAQEGNKVTGAIGPSLENQVSIDKGEVEDNRLRIIQGNHRVLELTLSGEALVGTMRHANDSEGRAARLELERVSK